MEEGTAWRWRFGRKYVQLVQSLGHHAAAYLWLIVWSQRLTFFPSGTVGKPRLGAKESSRRNQEPGPASQERAQLRWNHYLAFRGIVSFYPTLTSHHPSPRAKPCCALLSVSYKSRVAALIAEQSNVCD